MGESVFFVVIGIFYFETFLVDIYNTISMGMSVGPPFIKLLHLKVSESEDICWRQVVLIYVQHVTVQIIKSEDQNCKQWTLHASKFLEYIEKRRYVVMK